MISRLFKRIVYTWMPALLIFSVLASCGSDQAIETDMTSGVKTGGEQLISNHLSELEGKSVGLVMNPTAVVNGVHMLDTLMDH